MRAASVKKGEVMKKIIKLICFVLAVSMIAVIFCGCKGSGVVLATYDGGEVLSTDDDVEQWTKYFTHYYSAYTLQGLMTSSELGRITIRSIVAMRLRELEAEKRGLEITDEAVKEMYDYNVKAFDEQYDGGFKKAMKDYGLKKKFWMMFARNAVVEELIVKDIINKMEITDAELTEFYVNNIKDYIISAGYTYTSVFVEVKDLSDENEWAENKSAAQKYIDRIIAGEDFDKIKEEILSIYNEENGYSQGTSWSGKGVITFEELRKVDNLEETMKELDEKYAGRDPKADKDSEAYGKYLQYLADCMANVQSYAMEHMETGTVYSEPIISPLGWMILRLDNFREETYYPSLNEIRDILRNNYINDLVNSGKLMEDFSDELYEAYHVEIKEFSYGA